LVQQPSDRHVGGKYLAVMVYVVHCSYGELVSS